ncbi:MAG: hypothetical protein VX777_09730 [Chlamydiota bacterium]|nr:hypothetical protein [Chlamydiota bacterium]
MKTKEDIIHQFENFNLENHNIEIFRELTDDLFKNKNPESALAAMFGILERYPDEELGSPGPLVHAIEKCAGYEHMLFESLKRQPGTLTLWMLHRLIKYDPRKEYVDVLRSVIDHPKASEQTKEDAGVILSWVTCTSDE